MLPVIIPAVDGWVVVDRPDDGPVRLSTHHPDRHGQPPISLTPEVVQLLLAALVVARRDAAHGAGWR